MMLTHPPADPGATARPGEPGPAQTRAARPGGLIELVRRANRPGQPEHSVTLRFAAAGAVLSSVAACRAVGELSTTEAGSTMALIALGMWFSYRTRTAPRGWVKPVLAVGVVAVFVWFFLRVTNTLIADIAQVEAPLAMLFAAIQAAHAFDVPARRDLSFSLAGSASLMAVAAAQAVDLRFGVYVLVWAAFGFVGLLATWSAASAGGRNSARATAGALLGVGAVAFAVLVVLPAPHVAGNASFPAASAFDSVLPGAGGLTGDGSGAATPARPGSPTGGRVGGYLGFSKRLDTALRPALGSQVVMRVRAERPSYWLGEVFSHWDGRSWSEPDQTLSADESGSPFSLSPPPDQTVGGTGDLQTFYQAVSGPNLIFHAPNARTVWFPASKIYTSPDGTLVSSITMGPGTIYTVASDVVDPLPSALRAADTLPDVLPSDARRQMTQLPAGEDPRIAALATRVTAGSPTTYDKVEALIGWIGSHTRYSTDIPVPPPGVDAVSDFLFGNRVGFCEQISTSLAMLLRSVDIPAREAVGYVPGPFDPLTDLYDVQASDAHAWVQVWFPGYGWQSFDPTAVVPAANPTPGDALLHDTTHALGRVPWVPVGVTALAAGGVALALRRRRSRPPTWAHAVARRIERAGARAGRPRRPDETLREYAEALDAANRAGSGDFADRVGAGGRSAMVGVADSVERCAYGGHEPDEDERREIESALAVFARR